MAITTVYHANGAEFNCDTQERLNTYLAAGWTTKKPTKKKAKNEGEKPAEEQAKDEGEKPKE